MAVVRVHLFISGRVQRVYYRQNTMRRALMLGLTGWVMNLPDRRVEAVVEGEEDKVEEFVQWCQKGPPAAIVTEVEAIREKPTGEFRTFSIKG